MEGWNTFSRRLSVDIYRYLIGKEESVPVAWDRRARSP